MIQNLNPCPFCDGTGEHIVKKRHKLTNTVMMATSFCVCSQSRFISSQYKTLDYLKDIYLPIDEVENTLKFNPAKLTECPNYIIKGSLRCFHLHVKSILMKYRFSEPHANLWFSSSIGIIHNFHIPQADGDSPHLSSTETFDLLIITFGSFEENKALKYSMAQVVANRMGRKPVWIYLPMPTLGSTKEYSPELEEMIKDYTEVTLNCGQENSIQNRTQSQRLADGFIR